MIFSGIYRFAEGHNIEGLRDIALSYIHDNFFLVSQVIKFIFVCNGSHLFFNWLIVQTKMILINGCQTMMIGGKPVTVLTR